MSWSWENGGSGGVRMFGGGSDVPWWAAEEVQPANYSVRCDQFKPPEYQVATAVICSMFMVFGIVYSLFGYRCFKAVMFLTGFLFASVVVYLICLSEALLPMIGNASVALGAGILFGLITMLVQYVGLFMTGFHTGLFLGAAFIATVYVWWTPPNVWAVLGLLLITGLTVAVMTLYFQKGLTILGTAVCGGAIMAATLDYFIEEFLMVLWFRDRLMGKESDPPCWYSWFILAVWPFMALGGTTTQAFFSGKGIYHQQMVPASKSRNVNLNRVRSRESRAELRQKKYRYLYQVRTAHGDIISQEYVQALQQKASPAGDNGTLQSDSTHTTMIPSDQSQLAPLTESEDEALSPSGFYSQVEESQGLSRPKSKAHSNRSGLPSSSGLQQSNYRFTERPAHPSPSPPPPHFDPRQRFVP